MSQSYEYRREFAAEILEASFFGAFAIAIEARKNELGLTQAELAERTGREKTGISKLLSGPRNWTIRTISDLTTALDLRIEFSLVDQLRPERRFTATGVEYNVPQFQLNSEPLDIEAATEQLFTQGAVINIQTMYPGFQEAIKNTTSYFNSQSLTIYEPKHSVWSIGSYSPTNAPRTIDLEKAQLRQLIASQQQLLAEKDKQLALLSCHDPGEMKPDVILYPQRQQGGAYR